MRTVALVAWSFRPLPPRRRVRVRGSAIVKADDFFDVGISVDPTGWDLPGDPSTMTKTIKSELLEALGRGPVRGLEEIEVAISLAQLVHNDLERYGTGGGELLHDEDMGAAIVKTINADDHRAATEVPQTSDILRWLRNSAMSAPRRARTRAARSGATGR